MAEDSTKDAQDYTEQLEQLHKDVQALDAHYKGDDGVSADLGAIDGHITELKASMDAVAANQAELKKSVDSQTQAVTEYTEQQGTAVQWTEDDQTNLAVASYSSLVLALLLALLIGYHVFMQIFDAMRLRRG